MGSVTCAPGCAANPAVVMALPPCFICTAPATGG